MSWATFTLLLAPLVAGISPTTNFTTIETLHQCQPALIEWTGGDGPYSLEVNVGDGPSKGKRKILFSTYEKSFEWNVDLREGTGFLLAIQDQAHPGPMDNVGLEVQPGPDTCTFYGDPPRNVSTNSTTQDATSPQASRSKTPVGTIVGSVVGGVVGLLIILGLLLWNLKLRRKLKAEDVSVHGNHKDVTPFEVPVATQRYQATPPPGPKQALLNPEQPPHSEDSPNALPLQTPEAGRTEYSEPGQGEATKSTTQTAPVPSPSALYQQQPDDPVSTESQYEQDGGPAPAQRGTIHPPTYNSVWKT